jgi:hypothetical protein
MASIARGRVGRGVRLAVAGAVVFTTITMATAGASGQTQHATGPSSRPHTPSPGFLLDRGRSTSFDSPGMAVTSAGHINNGGQIVGAYRTTTPDLFAPGLR